VDSLLLKTNKQGHRIVRLHYSADPGKNPETDTGAKWFKEWSNRYVGGAGSLGWRSEYEIDFGAGSGELVFPEFYEKENEICIAPFEVPEAFTLFGGLDWGNRNNVSFHVYAVAPDLTFFSIWEHYVGGRETNVYKMAKVMKHECPYYDRLQVIYYDPSMNKEDQQRESLDDKTSIARMFQDEVGDEDAIDKLATANGRSDVAAIQKTRLLWFGQPKPRFYVFRTCGNQINEFRNLKYPERRETTNELEKILDKDNHAWDEWKYFLLSNPYSCDLEARPEFGSIGYLNRVAGLAAEMAAISGKSVQEEFNDLWGRKL